MEWFRSYWKIIHHPIIAKLPGETYKLLHEIKCLACEANLDGDTNRTVDDISWELRRKISKHIKILFEKNLIFLTERKTVAVSDWNIEQYKSDSSSSRVRAHRERKRQTTSIDSDNTTQENQGIDEKCNVTETLQTSHNDDNVTLHETFQSGYKSDNVTLQKRHGNALDTEADTDTEEISSNSKASSSIEVSTRPPEEHETRESRGDPPPTTTRAELEAALAENLKNFDPTISKQADLVNELVAAGVIPDDIVSGLEHVRRRKEFQGEHGQKLFESKPPTYFRNPIIDEALKRRKGGINDYRHTKSLEEELDNDIREERRKRASKGE